MTSNEIIHVRDTREEAEENNIRYWEVYRQDQTLAWVSEEDVKIQLHKQKQPPTFDIIDCSAPFRVGQDHRRGRRIYALHGTREFCLARFRGFLHEKPTLVKLTDMPDLKVIRSLRPPELERVKYRIPRLSSVERLKADDIIVRRQKADRAILLQQKREARAKREALLRVQKETERKAACERARCERYSIRRWGMCTLDV
jgi:hypothetical protein